MHICAEPRLFLRHTAYACVASGAFVFLDIAADEYSCLDPKFTAALAARFGLPLADMDGAGPPAQQCEDEAEIEALVRQLVDRGLAVRDPSAGKRASFVRAPSDLREMPGYYPGEGPRIGLADVARFFRAYLISKAMLRFSSLEKTVRRVERRKSRSAAPQAPSGRLKELVETYRILRPMFLSVKDNCLFNSLFLIEFLAGYGIYPAWCFGVRLHEFSAHAWVQDNAVVLDDFIHRTCQHQPIMAI